MNTAPPRPPDLDGDDADVRAALRGLARALPTEPVRDLDEVRTRARRRTVRDRTLAGVGAAAAVTLGIVVLGPVVQPVAQVEVAGDPPAVETPANDAPPQPAPEATTDDSPYPPASSEDGVTIAELRAWYALYWQDVDVDLPEVGIGDGVEDLLALSIELLSGEPAERSGGPRLAGEDAAQLAEQVAAYRLQGTTPTPDQPEPFLADNPQVEDLLRRLELTLRDEAGLGAPSVVPEAASPEGVTVDELRGWLANADDVVPGVLDGGVRETLTLGIEALTGTPDPGAVTTLAAEGLTAEDVRDRAREQVDALPGTDADLVPELTSLLLRLDPSLRWRAAPAEEVVGVPQPVPGGLSPLEGQGVMTIEELNAWLAAYYQFDGDPAIGDGSGRLLSMALEALTGAPDPREPLYHLEANGLSEGADDEVADEIAAHRADGANTFLADTPEVDEALRRTELMLRAAAES